MIGRYRNVASRAGQAASYIRPEIMAIPGQEDGRRSWPPSSWPSFAWRSSGCCATSRTRSASGEEKLLAMQSEMSEAVEPDLPPADRRRSEVRHRQEREGRAGRAEQLVVLVVPALARAQRAQEGVSSVLRAVRRRTRTRWPPRSAGSVQRDVYYAKARDYRQRAGGLAVSRQRAGRGLRQSDRRRSTASCRPLYRYLRRAPARR